MKLQLYIGSHMRRRLLQTFRTTSAHFSNISREPGHDFALLCGRAKAPIIFHKPNISKRKFNSGRPIPTLSRAFSKVAEDSSDLAKNVCKKVKLNTNSRTVDIEWGNGEGASFPYIFLRDSCLCPKCFDPSSRHRLLMLKDLDLNCTPSNLEISESGDSLHVTWDDGHQSIYPTVWLADHEYSEEKRKKRTKLLGVRPTLHLWGAEMQNLIPKFDFNQLMGDSVALYKWIYTVYKYGLVLITDAPQQPGQLARIGERVPFLKKTAYGTLYDVVVKENPSNVAYTDGDLPCHNDMPYTEYSPGLQMLHCIKQSVAGGENILVDGFFAAEKLKKVDRSAYDWLTTTELDHEDLGKDVLQLYLMTRQHLIELDKEGNVRRVGYSPHARATRQNIPIEMVEPMYRALKAFDDVICDPQTHIIHKSEPGQIVCMNNQRVMHGRKSFQLIEGGERHLEGAYIDWDQMLTKFRLLGAELGNKPEILDD